MTINRDNLKAFYEGNEDLKEYVEKYKQRDNITTEEALTHAMVWEKAKDIVASMP